ncbi:type III secretion system cytoplasmic ring protein SctQ (plasmid) [Ralstonia sp. 25C]|uniref:type III secretion system cytoplasmic ring protein SctQ n=1 Tax=Ralstonia sp. 25C TaxID=3447363 RepID=UPI003F74CECD
MNHGPTPSPLDAHLRAFTPAEAALTRLIGTPFSEGDAGTWQLRLADHADHATPMQAPLRLGIRASQCTADVVIDGANHPALHAIAQEGDADRRKALAGLWLTPMLDGLSAAGLGDAALAAFAPEPSGTPGPALSMRLDGPHGETRCRVASLDWHRAPPAPPMADRNTVLAQLGVIGLPVHARIASRQCATATLASLAPGDVLLGWGHHAYQPDAEEGALHLTFGNRRQLHFTAHAHYKEGTVTILDVPTLADDDTPTADNTAQDGAYDAADGIAVEALEVPVHLEVAVMSLPLAELAALAPSHVLQLPVLLRDATVRLVCHGQTLGHGQLVAVGDHLGLQISAMSARHAEH